jgi:hypothetical protein
VLIRDSCSSQGQKNFLVHLAFLLEDKMWHLGAANAYFIDFICNIMILLVDFVALLCLALNEIDISALKWKRGTS